MRICAALVLSMTVLAIAPTLPAWAESSAAPGQPALDKAIEQYIRSHPEVIEQALQSLEVKRQEYERLRVVQTVATHQEELLRDPASPVSGNLNGDVTVSEFFDYRCGYCKRAASAVTQLQRDDPGVRVVYKDFPILGENSLVAATAALASQAQGRHKEFHEALLAAKDTLTKDQILQIARDVGLNTEKLVADMDDSEWLAIIKRNQALAKDLGITGTPAFVVGNELVLGAVDLPVLKALIAQARRR